MKKIGIIGGTGLSQISGLEVTDTTELQTAWGEPSAAYIVGKLGELECVFLARHGNPHVVPPHRVNYRANIAGFEQLGVRHILAVNAVGGIHPEMPPEAIVLPDQLVDYTWGREHSYSDDAENPLQHIDFTHPFSPVLRNHLLKAASICNLNVVGKAVYGVTQGPRLETAAEIQKLLRDGCDIVGMTAMPEAALAAEKGMEYASISLVVNWAAGLSEGEITMEDINRVVQSGMSKIMRLIQVSLPLIADN